MTQRKLIRRTGTPKDYRHSWGLLDWAMARLPISPSTDLDKLTAEVIQQWQANAPSGETRKPTAKDHSALVDILAGASLWATGQHFTREGLEHYKGTNILFGAYMQAVFMRGAA